VAALKKERLLSLAWAAPSQPLATLKVAATRLAIIRIEREFDAEPVRWLKPAQAATSMLGDPELAAEAVKAGLVDEYDLFVTRIV
jgi:hypothetical protein